MMTIQGSLRIGATIAGLLLSVPCPALAQRPGKPPPQEWEVRLGAAAVVSPTFEGSDRYRVRPLPVVTVNWRDTISFGEGGLSAQIKRGGLRMGGGLTFDGGRKDHDTGGLFSSGDNRLRGMGDIDFALGFRGFASYRLGIFDFSASATKFVGEQNDGVLATVGISAPLPLGKKLIIIPSVRASWADDKYMQTFFGVNPLQASRSRFPRFNARAGFQDVRGGINVIYSFNRSWFTGANASITQLTGDSAISPISISDTNASGIVMVGYRF